MSDSARALAALLDGNTPTIDPAMLAKALQEIPQSPYQQQIGAMKAAGNAVWDTMGPSWAKPLPPSPKDYVPGVTPPGSKVAPTEATRTDRPFGAAMDVLGMMPVGGAAKAAAPLVAAIGARRGIRAFHGSPHDFDRFDISKIGTGEGAQAYGHGLYFAENEGVARKYRDTLSGPANMMVGGGQIDAIPDERVRRQLMLSIISGSNNRATPEKMIEYFDDIIKRRSKEGRGIVPSYGTSPDDFGAWVATRDFLKKNARDVSVSPSGRMYEVNINAAPEQFLDWDKPLSAQGDVGERFVASVPQPGWWSRTTGDMKDLRYSMATDADKSGADAYSALKRLTSPTVASSTLRDAGIPGIRYLDQGSRAAGQGSSNYVVFDDKMIDIIRKYGLMGMLGGAGGAAALSQPQQGM